MILLITGANGFMGKNLAAALRHGDDCLLLADVDTTQAELARMAWEADFVFHLAGVNRPKDEADFMAGNADFTARLLTLLEGGKKPPVLMSGSVQAALDNPYGISKRHAEEALRAYGARTGAPVYLYRLPNAFGKWSRPNYNSAVATFCYNIARDLPVTISDPARVMRLVYIDDIVAEFLRAQQGSPTQEESGFCRVLPEHGATLGQIVTLIESFRRSRETLMLPDQRDELTRKLYATYQSFLPPESFAYGVRTHADKRGAFTELLHTAGFGQVSVNVQKAGVVKGEHWHHTKHEKFIVVAGRGVIRLRGVWEEEVTEVFVDGDSPEVVDIPPGYTHNIENIGDTDMVTLMWASEVFNPEKPDTFHLLVMPEDGARSGT